MRNGFVDRYRIVYISNYDSRDSDAVTVRGTTSSDRVLTANGLQPRTNYTFEVRAENFFLTSFVGLPVIITTNTSVPQGKLL